ARDADARVVARARRVIDGNRYVRIAPEHVLAQRQRDLARVPHEAKNRVLVRRSGASVRERVAEAVHRAQVARLARVLADGAPDFGDESRKTRFGDEHAGPEPLDQLVLRERPRPRLDEQPEQLESLGREVNLLGTAPHLPPDRVERALAESDAHLGLSKKISANSNSVLKTRERRPCDRLG